MAAVRAMMPVYPRACGGTFRLVLVQSKYFGLSPRLRGTKVSMPVDVYADGLSPRLRGNPYSYVANTQQIGSIPAPAGEPVEQAASTGGE